jgi:hypothetical protein
MSSTRAQPPFGVTSAVVVILLGMACKAQQEEKFWPSAFDDTWEQVQEDDSTVDRVLKNRSPTYVVLNAEAQDDSSISIELRDVFKGDTTMQNDRPDKSAIGVTVLVNRSVAVTKLGNYRAQIFDFTIHDVPSHLSDPRALRPDTVAATAVEAEFDCAAKRVRVGKLFGPPGEWITPTKNELGDELLSKACRTFTG